MALQSTIVQICCTIIIRIDNEHLKGFTEMKFPYYYFSCREENGIMYMFYFDSEKNKIFKIDKDRVDQITYIKEPFFLKNSSTYMYLGYLLLNSILVFLAKLATNRFSLFCLIAMVILSSIWVCGKYIEYEISNMQKIEAEAVVVNINKEQYVELLNEEKKQGLKKPAILVSALILPLLIFSVFDYAVCGSAFWVLTVPLTVITITVSWLIFLPSNARKLRKYMDSIE